MSLQTATYILPISKFPKKLEIIKKSQVKNWENKSRKGDIIWHEWRKVECTRARERWEYGGLETHEARERKEHQAREALKQVKHEARETWEHIEHGACEAQEHVGHKAREAREHVEDDAREASEAWEHEGHDTR